MPTQAAARAVVCPVGAAVFVAASVGGAVAPSPTYAVPVSPGAGNVHLSGTTPADARALAGAVVAERSSPFLINDFVTGAAVFDGTLESRVVREAASQRLAFHYRIISSPGADTAAGAGELFRFTAFRFAPGFETDLGFLSDGPGTAGPSWGARAGDAVDFQFAGTSALGPGEDSLTFFIRTDATAFDDDGFAVLDALAAESDAVSGQVRSAYVDDAFRPITIPLPAALWTGAIGLATAAGAAMVGWRRPRARGKYRTSR